MSAARNRARLAWAVSLVITLGWAVAVTSAGWWSRVGGHWESAATMLFGSFLAGSSPEGGGAVAFPVFTKALDVPSPVARSFGLMIQAVGMSVAVLSIVLFRRALHARALAIGVPAAIAGFLVTVAAFGNADAPFWPLDIETAVIKATFSIVLATTSILMLNHRRHGDHGIELAPWSARLDAGVAVAAAAGGVLSAMAGTGANIVVFLFLVVLADVGPKPALATAIAVMASVSVVGLVLFGIVDGQLSVDVVDGRVSAVGGEAIGSDVFGPSAEVDLLGLWLAAVPVVVWGAPLGAMAAAVVPERLLVGFVALLAMVEVATTIVLVPAIRTDARLAAYLVAGVVGFPLLWLTLRRHRMTIFRPDPVGVTS